MNELYEKHMTITERVKGHIQATKVVLPAHYSELYTDYAKALNIILSADERVSNEMLDEKISRHIMTLSSYSHSALEAIKERNEAVLAFIFEETQKLHDEIDALKKVVYEDSLTKSRNRKWFEDVYLDDLHSYFTKNGTLVLVDLNRFKRVNDTFGHVIGDKVLIHFAEKLKMQHVEIVRFGGDEFLLLFDEAISLEIIKKTMEEKMIEIEKISFKVESTEFKMTFAYGIASFTCNEGLDGVLDSADKAMYAFKKGRRADE